MVAVALIVRRVSFICRLHSACLLAKRYALVVVILRGIALAAHVIPPIATRLSVVWSVCHLSHLYTVLELFDGLLKPFDGFTCRLAGTLVGFIDTLFQMGIPDPRRKGDLGVKIAAKTCNYKLHPNRFFYAPTWQVQTSDSAFCQITVVLVIIVVLVIASGAVRVICYHSNYLDIYATLCTCRQLEA